MGLLDPATSDGRVIFFLPFQNHTIAGTTDLPCKVTFSPRPTEDEIMFILSEVKNYLNPDVEGKFISKLVQMHHIFNCLSCTFPFFYTMMDKNSSMSYTFVLT